MTHNITLLPLVGMELDGQLLPFGSTPEEADRLLGAPRQVRGDRRFYEELYLDFVDDKLTFLECTGGIDGQLQPTLLGMEVFQEEADTVYQRLLEENGPDVDDSEAGYCYALRALSVGLYREITQADVDEMVKELMNIDLTALSHFDLAAEQRRADHWETVGIGAKDYYK